MPYALILDVPASWERYAALARSPESPPAGLLLHAAGPTDEGFRIIEVWESEAAWQAAPGHQGDLAPVDPDVGLRPWVRDLRAVHLVTAGRLAEAVRRP